MVLSSSECVCGAGSQELVYAVQKYHLAANAADPVAVVAGSLLLARWDVLVRAAAPRSWRESLAALLTHCHGDALAHYCGNPCLTPSSHVYAGVCCSFFYISLLAISLAVLHIYPL